MRYQGLIKEIKKHLYNIKINSIKSIKETPVKPDIKLTSETKIKYNYPTAI